MPNPSDVDLKAVVRALVRANREMADAMEKIVGPPPPLTTFVPTDFQQALLDHLKGKALRTDALANRLDCSSSRLFKHPGGIPELVEEGLVEHHKRLGYFRPDEPPPEAKR